MTKASNLTILPLNGHAPSNAAIAANLREQADWLEAEDAAHIKTCILVYEDEFGGLWRNTFGQPIDLFRAVGILQAQLIQSVVTQTLTAKDID